MKKLLPLILVACALALAGCGGQKPQSPMVNNGGTQAIKPTAAPDGESRATEDPSPVPDGLPSDEGAPAHGALPEDYADSDVIEIKEKLFIAQTNDIYLNPEDYLGKTIQYEGIFDSYFWEENGNTYYYVIRYGPGCCGFDANAGFEVQWDGEYPDANDWVEVVGVLERYEEDGWEYLRLQVSSMTVLPTRGAEYVSQ